jgi:hypothetical protein
MKKIITLLCVSFFTLVSCSSNEDAPIIVPTATAAQAVLDGGSINVTWPAVTGTGITYNIYRNDNPVKINTAPLTEAKFTDVLTATGSYTYTITVNLSGLESAKGIASEKVVLSLPKTRNIETYNVNTSNGVTTTTTQKSESVYGYDSSNIVKLISVSSTVSDSGSAGETKSKVVYTYTGKLLTKMESVDVAGVVQVTVVCMYNDKSKLMSRTSTSAKGFVSKIIYVYNADGTVSGTQLSTSVSGEVTPNGNSNVLTFLNGNLVKEVNTNTNNNSTTTLDYLFDTKNTSSKYILGFPNLVAGAANLNNVSSIVSSSTSSTSSSVSSTRIEFTYDVNGNVLVEKTFVKVSNTPERLSRTTTYTY